MFLMIIAMEQLIKLILFSRCMNRHCKSCFIMTMWRFAIPLDPDQKYISWVSFAASYDVHNFYSLIMITLVSLLIARTIFSEFSDGSIIAKNSTRIIC